MAEHNGHSCMGACILYGMHAATLCSVDHPTGLRKICGKFCKIYHEQQAEVGAIGFEVVCVGDAFTDAVDAMCHCVMNVRVRSMLLIVWHIVFLFDCTNHAQPDQPNANLTCEGFPHVRTWKELLHKQVS